MPVLPKLLIMPVGSFHVRLFELEIFGYKVGVGRSVSSPFSLCLSYQEKSVSSFANDHRQINLSLEACRML